MSAILKKEFREILKTKKFLIIAIVFLFVAVASPILAKLLPSLLKNLPDTGIVLNIPEATWRDSIDQFVKNLSQIALIAIVFVFAGLVAEEKNKRTLELILSKPVSRMKLILAKFTASAILLISSFAAASIIFYIYTVSLLGSFSFLYFCYLFILLSIYLLFVLAVVLFFSVMTSNQIISAALAFVTLIVVGTILPLIDKIEKYLPGYSLANYKDLMSNGSLTSFWPSVYTSIVLIVILIILTIGIFSKQEIER